MQGFPPLEVAPSQNIWHAVDDLPMPEILGPYTHVWIEQAVISEVVG